MKKIQNNTKSMNRSSTGRLRQLTGESAPLAHQWTAELTPLIDSITSHCDNCQANLLETKRRSGTHFAQMCQCNQFSNRRRYRPGQLILAQVPVRTANNIQAEMNVSVRKPWLNNEATHKRVTWPPLQFKPVPIQFDDKLKRGHTVSLLQP